MNGSWEGLFRKHIAFDTYSSSSSLGDIACVAGVERGRGIGDREEGKKGRGIGERGRGRLL